MSYLIKIKTQCSVIITVYINILDNYLYTTTSYVHSQATQKWQLCREKIGKPNKISFLGDSVTSKWANITKKGDYQSEAHSGIIVDTGRYRHSLSVF